MAPRAWTHSWIVMKGQAATDNPEPNRVVYRLSSVCPSKTGLAACAPGLPFTWISIKLL